MSFTSSSPTGSVEDRPNPDYKLYEPGTPSADLLKIPDEADTLPLPEASGRTSPIRHVDDHIFADLDNSGVKPSWVKSQGWPVKRFALSFHPSPTDPHEERCVPREPLTLDVGGCGCVGELGKPTEVCDERSPLPDHSVETQASVEEEVTTSSCPSAVANSNSSDPLCTPDTQTAHPLTPQMPPTQPGPRTMASQVLTHGHVVHVKKMKRIQVGGKDGGILDESRVTSRAVHDIPGLTGTSPHNVATVPTVEAITGKIIQQYRAKDAFRKREVPEGTASSPGVGPNLRVRLNPEYQQKEVKSTVSEKSASSYDGHVVQLPKAESGVNVFGSDLGSQLAETTEKAGVVVGPASSERRLPQRRVDPSTWQGQTQNSDNPHFGKVGEFLCHLYERDQLTDVIVHCGSYTFSAHTVVLSCYSPFFAHALMYAGSADSRHHVVLSTDVSPTAFHVLLDYMYTGDLSLDPETVAELLSASIILRMTTAEGRCRDMLGQLSPEKLLVVWEIAERNKLDDIAEKTIQLLAKAFADVVVSASFLNLDVTHLMALLSRDDLSIRNEAEVGAAAARWLKHDTADRIGHAARVMACVRLPLMTSQELFDVAALADFALKDDDVFASFLKANWYVTGRDLHAPCLLQLEEPQQRARNGRQAQEFVDTLKAEVVLPSPDVTSPRNNNPGLQQTRLLLVGGLDSTYTGNTQQALLTMTYNPTAHAWEPYSHMPAARAHHTSVVHETGIFVIGGLDPMDGQDRGMAPLDTVLRYDVMENVWHQVSPLKTARAHHSACVLHNMIYVIGGRSKDRILSSVERYDPERGTWTDVPPMTSQRLGLAVAAKDDVIYVAGGYGRGEADPGDFNILDTVECYDPFTNCWTPRGPLRVPRCHGSLVEHLGVLYLCGGLAPSAIWPDPITTSLGAIDVYCDVTDTWRLETELNIPRHQTCAAVLGGRLYVVGGMTTVSHLATAAVECYDLPTQTWDPDVGQLSTPTVGSQLVMATLKPADGHRLF